MGESLSPVWAIRIESEEEHLPRYWTTPDFTGPYTFPSRDIAMAALSEISDRQACYRVAQYVDNTWRAREEERFLNREYDYPAWLENPGSFERQLYADFTTPTVWHGVAAHSMYSVMTRLHFVHLAKGDPSKIAYTESAEKGMCDRQTVTTVGRYLTKHFSDYLSDTDIASLAAIHAEKHGNVTIPLRFAKTPDEFEAVYSMDATFSSCMQYEADNFRSKVHPCRVYGAGDLELAYLTMPGDPDRLNSRALIWRLGSKTLVGRVYGDGARLRAALAQAGIVTTSDNSSYDKLDGARLLRIEHFDTFVLPYIDNSSNATDCGDFLRIDSSGDIEGGRTDGLAEESSRYTCESCGGRMDEENSFFIENRDESWCEHCTDNHAFYCEHAETYMAGDSVEVRTGSVRTERWSVHAAERNAFQCEQTETWYSDANFSPYVMHDGTTIGPDYFEDECIICSISEEIYHASDCVDLDGEYVAQEHLPQGAWKDEHGDWHRHPELALEIA
jgi:hypothetical protein